MIPLENFEVSLFELLKSLSKSIDMVSPAVNNHHYQVAYTCLRLANLLDLNEAETRHVTFAALLHDIGALTLKERKDLLEFDFEGLHHHSEAGYWFLVDAKLLSRYAETIRYHHYDWKKGEGDSFAGQKVPLASHIIHLADRASILAAGQDNVLNQTDSIIQKIETEIDSKFKPELVLAFKNLAQEEAFWLDLTAPRPGQHMDRWLEKKYLPLDIDGLLEIGQIFQRIIDFRSSFTATHSTGVARVASGLAEKRDFNETEVKQMEAAGYFHDLGKLAVPTEILEKDGELTEQEFATMRRHTYYTYRALEEIKDLRQINHWAAYHHEKLNGSGYPFKLDAENLDDGARIMAVADIFTALTEDRPYRAGMEKRKTAEILSSMVKDGEIDGNIVRVLLQNFDELDSLRQRASSESSRKYLEFSNNLQNSEFLAATA